MDLKCFLITINTWWLANPNWGCSFFRHNVKWLSYSLSRLRLSCALNSHIGSPSQSCWWLSLERSPKFEHTIQSKGLWPLHFKHSQCWKGGACQVCFTLRSRDQQSKGMQDGCKVYMDLYMTSNESCCFRITWTMFKNQLSEVGLTQNRETMGLQNITTVDLLYVVMGEIPLE